MSLTKNINFRNFRIKNSKKKIQNILRSLLSEKNQILDSLNKSYKNSYYKKDIFRKNTYINNSPLCTRTYMQAVYLVHLGRNYLFYLVVH